MAEQLQANRANWDDRTRVHVVSEFYDVGGWLRERRGPPARDIEALGDVDGLRLLHLQCHFGLDTLQRARAGAEVTGVDFSEAAIDAARVIAVRAGLDDRAAFVCANETEPSVDDCGGSYTDLSDTTAIEHTRSYEWNHGIGEIVNSLIRHGLQVDSLVEHDRTVWQRFPWLVALDKHRWTSPPGMPRMPLTFTLVAHRPA